MIGISWCARLWLHSWQNNQKFYSTGRWLEFILAWRWLCRHKRTDRDKVKCLVKTKAPSLEGKRKKDEHLALFSFLQALGSFIVCFYSVSSLAKLRHSVLGHNRIVIICLLPWQIVDKINCNWRHRRIKVNSLVLTVHTSNDDFSEAVFSQINRNFFTGAVRFLIIGDTELVFCYCAKAIIRIILGI